MLIFRTSTISGKLQGMDINITPEQINKIDSGALIQNVVPNLTRDEREFIISGITRDEWDGLFDS